MLLARAIERHWPLLAILLAALALRLPFALHAPPFVDLDTRQYLKPAFNLLDGQEFGLTLRRTPGYPLLLAAALGLTGRSFPAVLTLQHALGACSAVFTAAIGRQLYGSPVGLAAGILVAVSAPLVLSEHALLTETPFTLLSLIACWLTLRACRAARENPCPLLAVGLLLGLATLCRPIGELLLPLPAVVAVLDGRGWQRTIKVAALVGLGAGCALVPWMTYNLLHHGVLEITHASGEVLITHTAVYAQGSYALPPDTGDPRHDAARRLLANATSGTGAKARTMYGPRLIDGLTRELNISPIAADDLLRDLALEQLRAQPLTYLNLLVENGWRVFAGKPADLEYAWQSAASEAWGASLPSHPRPASDANDVWLERLQPLLRLYEPASYATPISLLSALAVVGAWRERPRLSLLPALTAATLILAAVGMVGVEYRFRYPADPFLAILIVGGLRECRVLLAGPLRRCGPGGQSPSSVRRLPNTTAPAAVCATIPLNARPRRDQLLRSLPDPLPADNPALRALRSTPRAIPDRSRPDP